MIDRDRDLIRTMVRRKYADGTERIYERNPSALVVAGSMEQALLWIRELGFEPFHAKVGGRTALPYTPSRVRGSDFPRAREAFFAGRWESFPIDVLHRLWMDLGYLNIPITYVTAPDGEIVARKVAWFRWNAPSSNAPTRLHLLERADGEPGLGPAELLVSACGLQLTAKQARESTDWHQERRWGAPPDACGICTHELTKLPPGDGLSREALFNRATSYLALLRAQQSRTTTTLADIG